MLEHEVSHDPSPSPADLGDRFSIRTFRPADRSHVSRLYRDGLLDGHLQIVGCAPAHDIEGRYLRRPQDHFWVAECGGEVIGSIAIIADEQVAHLHWLRAAPEWQPDGKVTKRLVETATAHAREHGCLKLVFHTPVDAGRATEFFHKLGFEFSRARRQHGRQVLEFYLDLYHRPKSLDA